MAEDTSDDRLAHLGEDNLESAQMGTSHTGVSRGGEDVTDESELGLQRVDQLTEEGATVVDLAGDQQFWRFGHVIVDEAQELSPMQWRMIKRRTQGGSITIVGDVAQRSSGPVQPWAELLGDTMGDYVEAGLSINYRSPSEINDIAAAVLAEVAPGLSPAESIRSSGFQPDAVSSSQMSIVDLVELELSAVGEGTVAVVGFDTRLRSRLDSVLARSGSGLVVLSPDESKGLEFDSVVVVEPAEIFDRSPAGFYVACTRSTNRLRFFHERPLPSFLVDVIAG